MADVQVGDVLVSPDGKTEITTSSPAQIVELRFAGWAPKHRRTERRQRTASTASPGRPVRSARPDPKPVAADDGDDAVTETP